MDQVHYVLDFFDQSGNNIVYGVPGSRICSKTPLPIPNVGEAVVVKDGRKWRVNQREFRYEFTETDDVAACVIFTCSPLN